MPKLAANISTLFVEVPFLQRFAAAARCGFQAVEYQYPYEWQPQDIAAAARSYSSTPLVIVGDTNLPDLSWAFARLLGQYGDAFTSAGSGFGYSYPSPHEAWMRIDRILADKRHFRFRSYEVINKYISDHYAITSELELVP